MCLTRLHRKSFSGFPRISVLFSNVMTLIDDWHEAYLKHFVVVLSPCLNVQFRSNGEEQKCNFEVTSDIRQVMVRSVHVKGIKFFFFFLFIILYENVWKFKSKL